MNCEDFGNRWEAHVVGTIEPQDDTAMLEHSRACIPCGTKWREHEELTVLLGNVIGPLKPVGSWAHLVERLPLPGIHRLLLTNNESARHEPVGVHAGALLLAAFLGGMVAYLMFHGAGSGAGNGMEQLAYLEMMRLGRISPAAGMPISLGEYVSLMTALAFLIWVTRAAFWDVLFPIRKPKAVLIARWLAIPTALVGGLQLVAALRSLTVRWLGTVYQSPSTADLTLWLGTSQLLGEAWTIGFWLTLLILLFGVLNEVTARYARPLQ